MTNWSLRLLIVIVCLLASVEKQYKGLILYATRPELISYIIRITIQPESFRNNLLLEGIFSITIFNVEDARI